MPYIGKTPTVGNFQVCDAISVVNGQAAYTLQVGGVNVAPESANHMLVSLNGILQKPGSSFTISGSTMTFASNLATGDVIDFVQILGNVLDLGVPSDDTVTAAKIADDAVSDEHLDVTAITGQTAETSAADADTIIIHDDSASALRKMTRSNFLSGVGGVNTPAFQAYLANNQNCANVTYVKINFNGETFDSDNAFDSSSNYRFTPGVAGKYFLYAQLRPNSSTSYTGSFLQIRKNGSAIAHTGTPNTSYDTNSIYCMVDSDTDDYFEVFYYNNKGGSSVSVTGDGSANHETHFGGFRIIGA